MNRSTLAIVAVFIVCAGTAAWWAINPPTPAPVAVAETPKPLPATIPKPATRPPAPLDQPKPRVELPALPPAPVQATAPAAPVKTEPPATDPHTDLATAIPDIVRRLREGDLIAVMEEYMPPEQLAQMPPEIRATMEQQMQRPEAKQMIEMIVQIFESMKDQTPEMNAAGDEATYTIIDPDENEAHPFHFKKINGRWYVNEN